MTKLKLLTKGLLGASAITLVSAGTAFAGGTQAGAPVKNTFTLDYQVGSVAQPTISTCKTGDAGCVTETSTNFTVDRVINLTVASQGDNDDVAPGATNEQLIFTVTNNGNDTQAYSFALVNETGDNFDATTLGIEYIIDNGTGGVCDGTDLGGSTTSYTPGSGAASADLPADGVLCVIVDGDIPVSRVDTDEAEVSLIADTLQPTTGASPGTAEVADTGGNLLTGAAENVLADGTGTANEVANAGDHSATGKYVVESPDLTADKAVTVHSQDGSTCATFPGTATGGYALPLACMEYVITVENNGASATATNIDVTDILPSELEFIAAQRTGFSVAGTFSTPAANTDCSGTGGTACTITLTGASLAAASTGTITIRAVVQ